MSFKQACYRFLTNITLVKVPKWTGFIKRFAVIWNHLSTLNKPCLKNCATSKQFDSCDAQTILCFQTDYWTRTHGSSMFHILTVRMYLWSRIKTIGQHMCHVLYFTDIFSSYSPIPHNRFSTFSTITYISRHVFKIVHIHAILVAWDAHIFN